MAVSTKKVLIDLVHHFDDDSRTVLIDGEDTGVKFDSSLGVHLHGMMIGHLSSRDKTWVFESLDAEKFDSGILVNDYHWKNLEFAEMKVAEFIHAKG